jgi:hypothetical protein
MFHSGLGPETVNRYDADTDDRAAQPITAFFTELDYGNVVDLSELW